ncbi:MAG: sortase [Ruthenibacterium sp.]
MKKNKRGWLEICAGVLLLAIAGSIALENGRRNAQAFAMSQVLLAAIDAQPASPTQKAPCAPVDAQGVLGILEIPVLSLRLPVQTLYDEARLQNAPCRYPNTDAASSKLIVCGHNYRSQFASLHLLKRGDTLRFIDQKGDVHAYTVSEIITIAQNDFSALEHGDWDLSLFTCTANQFRRVLVRCKIDF